MFKNLKSRLQAEVGQLVKSPSHEGAAGAGPHEAAAAGGKAAGSDAGPPPAAAASPIPAAGAASGSASPRTPAGAAAQDVMGAEELAQLDSMPRTDLVALLQKRTKQSRRFQVLWHRVRCQRVECDLRVLPHTCAPRLPALTALDSGANSTETLLPGTQPVH